MPPREYPPRRVFVGIRLAPAGIDAIDQHAEVEDVSRSEMIRRLLAEALTARQRRTR